MRIGTECTVEEPDAGETEEPSETKTPDGTEGPNSTVSGETGIPNQIGVLDNWDIDEDPVPTPATAVYVSGTSSDETGSGKSEAPYATLTKAVERPKVVRPSMSCRI